MSTQMEKVEAQRDALHLKETMPWHRHLIGPAELEMMFAKIDRLERELKEAKAETELALGHLRYEALRILNPRQFAELHQRSMKSERFDDMVDLLVVEKARRRIE